MNFSSFLVTSTGFSMYCIVSLANNFTPSFPIWIPFISFSSLIAMTRTSKTTLNNGQMVKMGILVSFLTLEEMLFTTESGVSSKFVICGLYCVEVLPSRSTFWRVFLFFYHKCVLNFVKLFLHLLRWSYSSLISWCDVTYWLICGF